MVFMCKRIYKILIHIVQNTYLTDNFIIHNNMYLLNEYNSTYYIILDKPSMLTDY